MQRPYRRHIAGALTMTVISVSSCSAQASRIDHPVYDGRWWSTAQATERESFVAGYLDCYKRDLKGALKYEAKSIVAYRDLVSKYFADSGILANQTIGVALAPGVRIDVARPQ